MGLQNGIGIMPVDEKGVKLQPVPQFIEMQPPAPVPIGTTSRVLLTVGVRDFVMTHLGFTSDGVGLPIRGQDFRVSIEDIGASRTFQPAPWHITPLTGVDPFVGDQPAFQLPCRWRFESHTTIAVEFTNMGAIACKPRLLLVGFLDKRG